MAEENETVAPEQQDTAPQEQAEAQTQESNSPAPSEPVASASSPSDKLEAAAEELTKVEEAPKEEAKPGDTFGKEEPSAAPQEQKAAPAEDTQNVNKGKPAEDDEQIVRSIPSERGKARIQQIIAERQQAITDNQNFLHAIQDAGYDADTFKQVLQLGRWISSSNREDHVKALRFVDQVRKNIAEDIGEPTDGLDPLDSAPDLKERVDNLELDRDGALEILQARKEKALAEQAYAQQEAVRLQTEAQQRAFAEGQRQVVAVLQSHSKDIDYAQRCEAVKAWLSKPENMQTVLSGGAERWASAVDFLYKNIAISRKRSPSPLTSTSISRGSTAASADPRDTLANYISNL